MRLAPASRRCTSRSVSSRKREQDLRSEPLGKTLEGMRRQLADGRAAARCFDLPSVDETERLAVMKS